MSVQQTSTAYGPLGSDTGCSVRKKRDTSSRGVVTPARGAAVSTDKLGFNFSLFFRCSRQIISAFYMQTQIQKHNMRTAKLSHSLFMLSYVLNFKTYIIKIF
jgi:hypothetical protein